jgi:hypothetical protein
MRMMTLLAVVLALMVTSVDAQDAGDGGGVGGTGPGGPGGRHHGQQQKKADTQTPKPRVDEKAYSAALKGIPDKPYDPWHGVH